MALTYEGARAFTHRRAPWLIPTIGTTSAAGNVAYLIDTVLWTDTSSVNLTAQSLNGLWILWPDTVTATDRERRVGGNSGENEYGPWTAYSAKATLLPDGAEKAVEQYMPAGFLRGDNTISKDGRRIEGAEAYSLDGNTPFGKFVVSMVEGEGTRFPALKVMDGGKVLRAGRWHPRHLPPCA